MGVLTQRIDLDLTMVPVVVMTCSTLHNYCEINKVYLDEDLIRANVQKHLHDEEMHKNIPDPVFSGSTSEGQNIRSILTEYINNNLPDNYL